MKLTILDSVSWARRRDLIPTQGIINIAKGHGNGDGTGTGAGVVFLVNKDSAQTMSDGSGRACGCGTGQGDGLGESRSEIWADYVQRIRLESDRVNNFIRRTK